MRLLSLNVWMGRLFEELVDYVRETTKSIDIFCFQEVFSTVTTVKWSEDKKMRYNLFSELCGVLPGFCGFFSSYYDGGDAKGKVDHHVSYGLAVFVRKSIQVISVGDIFVFGNRNYSPREYPFIRSRTLQYVTILNSNGRACTICNFHGLWNGKGKTDTQERLIQSENARSFLDQIPHSKILCGDFNLTSNTESLYMLERDMKNLVRERGFRNTRSSFYPKRESEPYADYMLVSPDIKVHLFNVEEKEVSDHLPLVLNFTF